MVHADVQELVATTLIDLGFAKAKSQGERLIYCDRYYVGVRFAFEGISALWLAGAGHVRFVDDSGKLLKIVKVAAGKAAA